jgi:hypothetical protein
MVMSKHIHNLTRHTTHDTNDTKHNEGRGAAHTHAHEGTFARDCRDRVRCQMPDGRAAKAHSTELALSHPSGPAKKKLLYLLNSLYLYAPPAVTLTAKTKTEGEKGDKGSGTVFIPTLERKNKNALPARTRAFSAAGAPENLVFQEVSIERARYRVIARISSILAAKGAARGVRGAAMSALWRRACNRSGRGTLDGDLRRVLRGDRQDNTSVRMVLRIACIPCAF